MAMARSGIMAFTEKAPKTRSDAPYPAAFA
jgi:hypothetical protein